MKTTRKNKVVWELLVLDQIIAVIAAVIVGTLIYVAGGYTI